MDSTTPISSPWIYQATDYRGSIIRITITFDNTTRVITGGTVFRDAACVYTKIYLGDPATTLKVFTVAAGTTNLNVNQLNNNGLNVIEDVLATQVTAGT